MTGSARSHRAGFCTVCLCAGLASLAWGAFDENDAARRHVGIKVYARDGLLRSATGTVVARGVVLTDAGMLARSQRLAVVSPGGAEIAASLKHADPALNLAVLEVTGLDQPAVPFAQEEVTVGQDRFVYAVAYDPAPSRADAPFGFRAGSIGSREDAQTRRSEETVPVYVHNAVLTAAGFGGSLLNNCGELIGLNRPSPTAAGLFSDPLRDPVGVVYASRLAGIEKRLDEWEVEYQKSDKPCLTAVESAAVIAAAQADEAKHALEEAKRREQELTAAANAAREAGDAVRAEAEAAQRAAAAAVEAAERQQALAEEAATAAQDAAAAESAELGAAIADAQAERERLETRSRTLAAIAAIGGVLLVALVPLLVARGRRKNRLIAAQKARAAAAESELEKATDSEFPDCLLEGSDSKGATFGLKIPGSSLRGGVDGVVLGRSPDRAAFVLDHPSISRAHCRLYSDDGLLHVEDLRATNGVLLNGDALAPAESRPLREGDRLTLGTVELTLRLL